MKSQRKEKVMTLHPFKSSLVAIALAWPVTCSSPALSAAAERSEAAAMSPTDVSAARAAARTTTVTRGPRGGTAVRRTTTVHGGAVRPAVRTGAWVRPGNYYWRPGGAIAAGAAIGVVSAATAAAWAGLAPGSNMCWYYTDASRRQGFWDQCQ